MKKLCRLMVIFWFSLLGFSAAAQEAPIDFNDVISKLFTLQRYYYPQEKTYLHLDRNHYVAGDTIWFRGHLLNAATHLADTSSRYLYVELVNPADSVVRELRIRRSEGAYPGYIALPDDIAEGNYTIWAYTMFMRNAGKDYYFQAPIRVSDPLSVRVTEEVTFSREAGSKDFSAAVRFREVTGGEYKKPEVLKAAMNRNELRTWNTKTDQYTLSFRNVDSMRHNVLLLSYDKSRRYVEIPAPGSEFDVTFHPEGGYLIEGDMNTIGFKAVNAFGQSLDITGTIYNSKDEMIGDFTSGYKGIGTFTLFPQSGETYYALCVNESGYSRRFELPEARNDAFGLKVLQRSGMLYTTFSVPESRENEPIFVIIQSRGEVFYTAQVPSGQKNLRFNSAELPTGIAHILLIDSQWNTLNERLVFIRNNDQAHVAFNPGKTAYGRREKATATVSLTDSHGRPLTGDFSVSVTDSKDLIPDSTRNIYTEILLASDLKGYIDSPAWYFEDEDPVRALALDALMLTQGWRRYDVPALLQKKVAQPVCPLEASMYISGRVKILASRRYSAGTPVYMIMPSTGYYQLEDTDEEGRFAFAGYEVPDSASFYIQAMSKRGNDKVEVILDQDDLPPQQLTALPGTPSSLRTDQELYYIAKADQKWIMENGMRTIQMETVEVTGSAGRKDPFQETLKGMADNVFDQQYFDEYAVTEFESLLYMIPGLMITANEDGDEVLQMRGSTVKFLIDDVPAWEDFDWRTINLFDVEKIFVFRGLSGQAMYGGPRISIYLKRGAVVADRPVFNRVVVNPLGFQKPVAFYAPKYETAQQRSRPIQDLRTTIYWNPSVKTDDQGKASFEFYTADTGNTIYSVVIEGLTEDGKVIRSVEQILRSN